MHLVMFLMFKVNWSSSSNSCPLVFFLIFAVKPCPPKPLIDLTDVTSESITLKWKPGWDGNLPQTFTIEYSTNGINETVEGIPDGKGTLSWTLTKGIVPKHSYQISISAANDKGSSSAVSWPEITTPGE